MKFVKFSFLLTLFLLAEQSNKYDVLLEGKPVVEINSRAVRLADLVKITPISNLDLGLAVGSIVVVESLNPGQTVILRGQDVLEKIQEKGFNLDVIGYIFPTEFNISRTGGEISKNDVKEFLLATALKDRDVEVLDVQVNNIVLPSNPKIIDLVDFTQTHQKLKATLLVGREEESFAVDTQVTFQEYRNVPVFVFSVDKGQKITEDMLALRRLGVGSILKDSLPLEECIGRVLKVNVKAGEVCALSKTMKELLVKKKEPVEVIYQSGGLVVKMLGESLSDAGEGDVVLVKNPSSGRIVQGVLSKDKKVLIQ